MRYDEAKGWDQWDEEFDRLCKSGSEDGEQMALFGWAHRVIFHDIFPELENMFAVPNGGDRSPAMGARLKATGTKPGVPDIGLTVARAGKHGLWIELKKAPEHGGGKPSHVQLDWKGRLQSNDYGWALCLGWKQARAVLVQYLSAPKTRIEGQ